jgi:hypothetical protein
MFVQMAVKHVELSMDLESGMDRKLAQEHGYYRCDGCAMFTLHPSQPCTILGGLTKHSDGQGITPTVCTGRCRCRGCNAIDINLIPAFAFVPQMSTNSTSTTTSTDVAGDSFASSKQLAQITAQNQLLDWMSEHVVDGNQRVLRSADLSSRSLKPSAAKKVLNKLASQHKTNKPVIDLVEAVS